jgi:predicted DNA-binding ArsR family transcriptional regulator
MSEAKEKYYKIIDKICKHSCEKALCDCTKKEYFAYENCHDYVKELEAIIENKDDTIYYLKEELNEIKESLDYTIELLNRTREVKK